VIALDASVLIGHLTSHDAHPAAATDILLNAAPGSMLVHPLSLAELRVGTGLELPDCSVLDVALHFASSLATFDDALAAGARQRGVPLLP